FIERVTVTRDYALSQIVWRWPDVPGHIIDPDGEGEPTPAFRLFQAADASDENGGVQDHVGKVADMPDDAAASEAGEHASDTGNRVDPAAPNGLHDSNAAAALDVVLAENDLSPMDDASGLV